MTELFIIYFVGAVVTSITSQWCLSRYRVRMTFLLFLFQTFTALFSWIGMCILYVTFKRCEIKEQEHKDDDVRTAAKHYLHHCLLYDDVYVGPVTEKDCILCFEAGADWQHEQDKMTEKLIEVNYAKGFEACKQQMMKDAVDGLVACNELTHGYKDIVMAIPNNLNVGDKVKLIIIKED